MSVRVLIVDYNDQRRAHLRDFLKARFNEWDVDELATHPPIPPRDIDTNKLSLVKTRHYDLMIGHLGGNPSGYDCLKVFKDHNSKGKVVLYTKSSTIQLEQFNQLKLADRVFKRSENDAILFDNAGEMMTVIEEVMKSPGVTYWKNPFKEPTVLVPVLGLATAVIGLTSALVKALMP